MNSFRKTLLAAGIGLAVLAPAAYVVADTGTSTPTTQCTDAQRAEHRAASAEIRAKVVADLAAKGITDPVQIRDAVRAEMTARFGDLPGTGTMAGQHNGTGQHNGNGQHLGTGTGNGTGRS